VDTWLLVLAGIRALESLHALAETGGWEMRIECFVRSAIDAMLGAVDVQTFPQVTRDRLWIEQASEIHRDE